MMTADYKQAMWRSHHHRFGMAGEGQADIISTRLATASGGVLYVGGGADPRPIANLAEECERLVVVDNNERALQMCRPPGQTTNIDMVTANALCLPFKDDAFAHVLALGLFTYIRDTVSGLRSLARVCRPGGFLMITNAVSHGPEKYLDAAPEAGLVVVEEAIGYCPAPSGEKRRQLVVYRRA